jgi:high-affinity K+ transport system ATPase subunit B
MNHYITVVIWRIALALDLIMLSNNKACGFAAIGITAVYLILLIVMRPYLKNVRPILNVVVVLAILAIESVYKMNFYSQDAQFMTSYLPLFVVVLLLVLLLANVIFMILEVKDRWKKNQIDKYQKNDDESFDEELKKELQRQMDVVNAIQMALQPTNISKLK